MSELEVIRDLLVEHRGEENAIASHEIAAILGIDEDDTHPKARRLIKKCIEKYNLPVSGDDNGYYYMTDRADLDRYVNNLNGRIAKIAERRDMVIRNFEESEI